MYSGLFIVSNEKEESFSIQRVNGHQKFEADIFYTVNFLKCRKKFLSDTLGIQYQTVPEGESSLI